MIDLGLNLRHSGHLNLEFAIDAVDLFPHNIQELPTLRRLLAGRALRAVFPCGTLRADRSFRSASSSFSCWSTLADSPVSTHRTGRTRRTRNPLEPASTPCALHHKNGLLVQ